MSDRNSLDTNELESPGIRSFNLQGQLDSLANPREQFVERPRLSVATRKRRNAGHVESLLVAFDDNAELLFAGPAHAKCMAEAINGPTSKMAATTTAPACCNHCGGVRCRATKTGKIPASVTMTLATIKPRNEPTEPATRYPLAGRQLSTHRAKIAAMTRKARSNA